MKLHVKELVDLTVPQYLIFSVFTTISAFILLSRKISIFELPYFEILSLSFFIFGLNSSNQIFDLELDKQSKPGRPIPSGKMTIRLAAILSVIFFAVALFIALMKNNILFFLIITCIVASLLYSAPQFKLKKYFLAGNFFGGFFYGAAPFLAASFAISKEVDLFYLTLFTSLTFFIATFKDFEDLKTDKKFEIATMPAVFGEAVSFNFSIISVIIINIITIVMGILEIIDKKVFFAGITSILIIVFFYKKIHKKLQTDKKNSITSQGKAVNYAVLMLVLIEITYATFLGVM